MFWTSTSPALLFFAYFPAFCFLRPGVYSNPCVFFSSVSPPLVLFSCLFVLSLFFVLFCHLNGLSRPIKTAIVANQKSFLANQKRSFWAIKNGLFGQSKTACQTPSCCGADMDGTHHVRRQSLGKSAYWCFHHTVELA